MVDQFGRAEGTGGFSTGGGGTRSGEWNLHFHWRRPPASGGQTVDGGHDDSQTPIRKVSAVLAEGEPFDREATKPGDV